MPSYLDGTWMNFDFQKMSYYCPMENIKQLAAILVEHTAYNHYQKTDLETEEIKNPIVVQSAMDYCLKRYKSESGRIDPDASAMNYWQDMFWHIAQNYR